MILLFQLKFIQPKWIILGTIYDQTLNKSATTLFPKSKDFIT